MTMSAHYHARDNNLLAKGVIFLSVLGAIWLPTQVLSMLFIHTGPMGFYEEWEATSKPAPTNKWSSYRFPEHWRYVWRAVTIVTVVGMIVAVLTLSMQFDLDPFYYCKGNPAMAWASTWLSAYALLVLVIDPIRILLTAALEFYNNKAGAANASGVKAATNLEAETGLEKTGASLATTDKIE